MKIRPILCLIIVTLFCGCGLQKGGSIRQDFSDFGGNISRIVSSKGAKAENSLNNQEISNSDYGYVVGAFNGRNEWVNIEKSYQDDLTENETIELPFQNNPYAVLGMKTGFSYDIYKLKPGRYTLVFYTSNPQGNTIYRSIDPDKDQNELIKTTDSIYASFDVKAGEIVYIGDINIVNSKQMEVRNNQELVIAYLNENYKNIDNVSDFVQTKLINKGINFR